MAPTPFESRFFVKLTLKVFASSFVCIYKLKIINENGSEKLYEKYFRKKSKLFHPPQKGGILVRFLNPIFMWIYNSSSP